MKTLKAFFNRVKLEYVTIGLALLVVGILFLIFPANSMKIVCYVTGAVFLLAGTVKFISFFVKGMYGAGSLAFAALMFCLGLMFIIRQGTMQDFIALAFGLVLIADGFEKLQEAIGFIRLKRSIWVLLLLEAALFTALGIVVLVQPFEAGKTLGYFLGASLIAEGIVDILTAVLLGRAGKAVKAAVEAERQNPEEELHEITED